MKWNRLDNAAKIFPPSSTKTDTHVFRFSCELCEEVEQEILQQALNETAEHFPVYQCVLKRGIFWYYLDNTQIAPVVTEEYKPPCSEMYDTNQKKLLYEVTYYRNIINFEVYHVLTDGTGAMHFLRTLLTNYLANKYKFPPPALDYDASFSQMEDDGFRRYYKPTSMSLRDDKDYAYIIRGQRLPENRIGIIRGTTSVKSLLDLSRAKQTTLTTFLTAVMILSIGESMTQREKEKPVTIAVPVNLRNYFKSESARNFFCLIHVSYDFLKQSGEFSDILESVCQSFAKKLTTEYLTEQLNRLSAIENNPLVRVFPLFLKDLILRIAYIKSSRKQTATFSNVGIVKMPDSLRPYIRGFDVCNSTQNMQVCVCSYDDILSISFTSPYADTEIQRRFFRTLAEHGLEIEITTNILRD